MERIKRAIILAAGEGKRLRPVTLTTPKPLIKVKGRSFIHRIIDDLKKNDIHEIYIVTGYKKECFYEAFKDDPEIKIIENPYYLDGNNITSIYVARDYLPESFIIEGDQIINDPTIFNPEIEKSGYVARFLDYAPEWAIKVENGRILDFSIEGRENSYRLWGVSMDAYLQYHGKDFNVMAGVSNFGPKAQSTVVPTKYALVPVARLSGDYVARVGIVHLQPALSAEFAFNREWAVAAGFQLGLKDIGWLRAGYRYASAGSVMPSHLSLGAGATFYGVRLSATFLTANKEIGNTFLIGLGYSF